MIDFGIDRLLKEGAVWKSQPISMITNAAATTNMRIPSRKALIEAGFNIQQLFSPEHGLDTHDADGAHVDD
ncbi:MAG: exo-beta-N-acetylmuramidase NamZ domain-containing protein, partial [Sediminibacterium sp.]